ncbi:MAG: hypothetical protein COW02_05070 [Comamonadaceae bacterium CG12_big_fil_rev_8_21_14_0_65_59_15]|nr:MAG: hypothetical protein COW02_05070 [Comamonadaceae bacterium CG12_big_fil_rev_8_21_14_0_65_59_15]
MSAEDFAKKLLSDEGIPSCDSAYEVLVGCVHLIDFVNNANDGNEVELSASWGLLEPLIRDHIEFVEGTDSVDMHDDMTRALLRQLVDVIRQAQKEAQPFVLDNEAEWRILEEEAGRFMTDKDELFVIASDKEEGFWSCKDGWGDLCPETSIYSAKEAVTSNLPVLGDSDAKWMSLNEAMTAYKKEPGIYGYYIDLDERGDFQADVRDVNGKTIFEIRAGESLGEDESSIFDDGYMRNKDDLSGLTEYMIGLGIIAEGSDVLPMSEFEARTRPTPSMG